MHLPRFQYLAPASYEEAARFLVRYGYGAKLAAGGTDLYPRMKYGLLRPAAIISLKAIPPAPPQLQDGDSLRLDPLMTLSDLIASDRVRKHAPLLAEAAWWVGSNQIRNMATLGGNLCLETRCLYLNQGHGYQFVEPCFKRGGDLCYFVPKGKRCFAVFMADTAPALICMDAVLEIRSAEGIIQIPLERFYSGDPLKPLNIGRLDIITGVLLPGLSPSSGSAFGKLTQRGGLEFGALAVAAMLEVEEDGLSCREARIAVGSVSAAPVRALGAESWLKGKRLDGELLEEAARMVTSEITPVAHHGYSVAYLKRCLEVQAGRVLKEAFKRIRR